VLGGGQVLMADTPARLSASQEFTESFFGAVPQSPKLPLNPRFEFIVNSYIPYWGSNCAQ